jgi:hypothetical protein
MRLAENAPYPVAVLRARQPIVKAPPKPSRVCRRSSVRAVMPSLLGAVGFRTVAGMWVMLLVEVV